MFYEVVEYPRARRLHPPIELDVYRSSMDHFCSATAANYIESLSRRQEETLFATRLMHTLAEKDLPGNEFVTAWMTSIPVSYW